MQTVVVASWKLTVILVIGIPTLSVLSAYLVARFTHAFDSYSEERAKLLAQLHNLDKLVEQTKILTATTETIKSQLSDEVWGKQQRWLKRLDTYVAVIEALQKYQQASVDVQAYAKTRRENQMSTAQVRLAAEKHFSEAMGKYNTATALWTHTLSLAQLTCPKEAMRALHQFRFPNFIVEETETILPAARLLAAKVSNQFVSAARSDLGYEPLPLLAILPLPGANDPMTPQNETPEGSHVRNE